ncbi:MAG: hypothetical protein M3301_09135 [Chloroflexota bacterium]|nr:hypothetical protein [Chloroflexota bacterium]
MSLSRVIAAVRWLVAAVIIAFGAAGLVMGADHPPGEARPELTARADADMAGRLARVAVALEALEADVTRLGQVGRTALVHLSARSTERLNAALGDGDKLVAAIQARQAALRTQVRALPHGSGSERIGPATRARLRAVDDALGTVDPLPEYWERLVRGTLPAISLTGVLERHDRNTFAATQSGTLTRYREALQRLDASLRLLDEARRIRDRLANAADVSVLDQWLARNRRYDQALIALYRELAVSPTRVTTRARQAFAAVQRLQPLLPADTRALVVIMADIARGGLNQAVIGIEDARGRLAAASAAVH